MFLYAEQTKQNRLVKELCLGDKILLMSDENILLAYYDTYTLEIGLASTSCVHFPCHVSLVLHANDVRFIHFLNCTITLCTRTFPKCPPEKHLPKCLRCLFQNCPTEILVVQCKLSSLCILFRKCFCMVCS